MLTETNIKSLLKTLQTRNNKMTFSGYFFSKKNETKSQIFCWLYILSSAPYKSKSAHSSLTAGAAAGCGAAGVGAAGEAVAAGACPLS